MKTKILSRCLAGLAAWCFLAISPAIAAPPLSTGGPDVFGYRYTDSRAPGGPQYNFVDISPAGPAQGIQSTVTGNLDSFQAVDIGFRFRFYDNEYTDCFIVSHGFLRFAFPSTDYTPDTIPNALEPNNIIAGLWTDLDSTAGSGSGAVYYKTIGAAPNRKFIVQYNNVQETYSGNNVTFQIQLIESSNRIEVHYKEITPRIADAGRPTKFLTIGLENATGTSGLQYLNGERTANHGDIPARPFVVRFDRPVVVQVESVYGANKVSPIVGPTKVPYESLQRFEAPEFIYLNRNREELPVIGELNDPDPDKISYYRARNLGYAIDGETVQGVERFFERTIARDMKVIWRWELEYAVFIESKDNTGADLAPGIGNAIPAVGRVWVTKDTQFSASVDRTAGQDPFGLDISGFRFKAVDYQLNVPGPAGIRVEKPPVPVGGTGNRVLTENVTITDWVRVRWSWAGQMRYRFDAAVFDAAQGNPALLQQSFVRTFPNDIVGTPEDESLIADQTYFSVAPTNEVWLDVGRKVQVGSFYRTFDRCWTLGNFVSPPSGDFGLPGKPGSNVTNLSDITLDDLAGNERVARATQVEIVTKPTEVHFLYQPTVFRAEIPLGQAFDAVNPDLHLIPALCDGAVLRAADLGPAEDFTRVGTYVPDGTATGFPVRWDELGKRLLPVHPGSYQLVWPDAKNPAKSYKIEIVSGYPNDTVTLASEREFPTGMREGTAPAYVTSTLLQAADSGFPGSPGAHYRHRYDSNPDRNPPTKLDLSATDHWKFQGLTFTDRVANVLVDPNAAGTAFTARGTGRSVLLYSYRPNPDEVADGTLADENLAVRVVDSLPVVSIQPNDVDNPLARRGLVLGGGSTGENGAVGVVSRTGSPVAISPAPSFVLDFWLNTKNIQPGDGSVKVLSTGAGKLEVVLNPATSTIEATYFNMSVERPLPVAGGGWHHFVIHVFGENFFGIPVTLLDFYADGLRNEDGVVTAMLTGGASGAFTATSGLGASTLKFGAGAKLPSALQIDQVRLFNTAGTYLTPGEVRSLRERRTTSLRNSNPLLRFDFESPPNAAGGVYSFASAGSITSVGVGPKSANDPTGIWEGFWARLDIQEVATRLDSPLDDAGFNGSGYILNAISNYNAGLYQRGAEVGTWGAIFPVNEKRLYTSPQRRLEVAYYENPYRRDELSHPNVAWPYRAAAYDEVIYPTFGAHKDKAIYIASRLGSEGVDQRGKLQRVYGLDRFANLQIYNQPINSQAGYNPNEEHAITAGSNRAALKVKETGEDIPNSPPLAAFALQKDVNVVTGAGYTSEPWVLVQLNNLSTGEPEMAAYKVFATRAGTIPFPRPTDATVNATAGLAYESAANPEDRFLTMDPTKAYAFEYKFDFPAAAGDLLIPPYPLNLVIGNTTMRDARGKNIQLNGVNQRTLWRDVNGNAWVVSGNGRFFHQYFYPFRGDFYLPAAPALGTPVAWLPDNAGPFTGTGTSLNPVKVIYNSFWRADYPKLKRGETLTYQGGEYFNENPGSNGLPALVAMAAAELVYDSAAPSMIFGATTTNRYAMSNASARIIRPLDRRERLFTVAKMGTAGFTPAATAKLFIVAERWYFKELPGSLQKRFYFDSLAEKLVFRGRLNDKESGDPDLTAGPDPINSLEPNVITSGDYALIRKLSANSVWTTEIDALYLASQNPHAVPSGGESTGTPVYLSGVKGTPTTFSPDLKEFWLPSLSGPATSPDSNVIPLDSFGVGSALVPNASLLTQAPTGSLYITVAENNRTELNGAPISLHIIEIVPDRYRGAIKVIEGADAFSEKITLQHNGEFGANTDDLYYEWWIRDAAPLDVVAEEVFSDGTLKQTDATGQSLWQEYLPKARVEDNTLNAVQKHLGLHTIVFEGRPDVVLADKLVLMRYRHKNETNGWKLVPFEFTDPAAEWRLGSASVTAPFQWAGAANSPQLQADGSKRYIPQLVMGWVKRVLDRINPYEARYTDFFSNESPATYSSQIQIAGGPFAGAVALNPDKNVIENTGLIELYETVLQRARDLSIDNSSNPVSTDGINQALLLATTRLSVLYELLAREAYSDAQDPTISVTDDDVNELETIASFTHAFQGLESDLLNEELALLRGTDFRKSYPVFNRMFWNYTKGLGEAAYNVHYNIYDENTDGFINEDDARALYPQGHGDSWGHFVSATGMHYELLQHSNFNWRTRSELYSLMQNVLEVDYLDEKTFARLSAGKARAGRDIVRGTYRVHYTHDPDGQWQGYTDGADPARAWGVSEWAHRAGQGAYFDWAVANALLPEDAGAATPVQNPENLDRIERFGAMEDIGEIAGGLHEIQTAMDEANGGVNPLGFDSDTIAFDIDPTFLAVGSTAQIGTRAVQGLTHFEQIYERALTAGKNAVEILKFATNTENKLRHVADDTNSLITEALRQDLDYRNRLIEIFGRPYDGTIGFGKVYPEGYLGPDTVLYAYLDRVKIDKIVPQVKKEADTSTVHFNRVYARTKGAMNNQVMVNLYSGVWADSATVNRQEAFETLIGDNNYELETEVGDLSVPYDTASKYGFVADPAWGQRTSYGRAQRALEEMLLAEIALDQAMIDYIGFLQDWEVKTQRILSELELFQEIERLRTKIENIRSITNGVILDVETLIGSIEIGLNILEDTTEAVASAAPSSVGFSVDVGAIARGISLGAAVAAKSPIQVVKDVKDLGKAIAEYARDESMAGVERQIVRAEQISNLEGLVEGLVNLSGGDQPKRDAIGMAAQELEIKKQEYFTAVSEGFRILREREAFNKVLAAKVQKNRYQDMIVRISRNEVMGRYQSAFNLAARYTWLAAKAYDYETSLDPGHPAAATQVFDRIVKTRQLGLWEDGAPKPGQGGLGEILALLNGSYQAIEGQIGLNSVQIGNEGISMRSEHFRIGPPSTAGGTASSDARWEDGLKARIVPDLWQLPEFRQHCRPFADPVAGPQPGLVIRFSSTIEPGMNFFGRPLAAGDHAYSSSQFATRIATAGVQLEGYPATELAATPRGYLIPIGTDYFRVSTSTNPVTRMWTVRETRIPVPFTMNQSQIMSPGYIPSLDGVDGAYNELRRHADFRMYHGNDLNPDGDLDVDDDEQSTRLIARSIWNSDWLLIIPGAGLHGDPNYGLNQFAEKVSDIKLNFKTYSHNGQ
jgi:hypothetical protein